ncbi:MAG: two-component system sensor histidine kinase PhoQ, partial [Gammaproteobacteria bacterium]
MGIKSLRTRLLLVASLVLIVFTGIALALLDRTFRQTAESSLQDNLQAQMYALLTVVEPAADGALDFIETLAEPRFSVADSGLYAFIYDEQEFRSWNSASALSIEPPETVNVATGDRHFGRETNTEGDSFYVMRFGVAWDLGDGVKPAYTFVISESSARFDSQISKFRENLFLWSSIATFTLLALQLLMLRWALDPLQRVAREISRVEQGVQSQITGEYPQEISTLTNSLNGLILSSRRALERYRNSLGDLAHSLKTPLAVLRGASPNIGPESEFELTVDEQVDRMQLIVDFQLRRAGNSGGAILIKPLLV